MKSSLPIIGVIGGLFVLNSMKKPLRSSTKKIEPEIEIYEKFPEEVDKKINEENIYKYYSKVPIWIHQLPFINDELTSDFKTYYDPKSEYGNEKGYIRITPELAEQSWNYAKWLLINQGNKFSGKTVKDADLVTKEILSKFSPNIYWKEGLIPYIWGSPFTYVWSSVNFLVRLAYANINNLHHDFAPSSIGVEI